MGADVEAIGMVRRISLAVTDGLHRLVVGGSAVALSGLPRAGGLPVLRGSGTGPGARDGWRPRSSCWPGLRPGSASGCSITCSASSSPTVRVATVTTPASPAPASSTWIGWPRRRPRRWRRRWSVAPPRDGCGAPGGAGPRPTRHGSSPSAKWPAATFSFAPARGAAPRSDPRPTRARRPPDRDCASSPRSAAARGSQTSRIDRGRCPGRAGPAGGGPALQLRRARFPGNRDRSLPDWPAPPRGLRGGHRRGGHADRVGRPVGSRPARHRHRLRRGRDSGGEPGARRRLWYRPWWRAPRATGRATTPARR